MELLLANEGAFRLPFFLVLKKKKKKRSPCSIVAHLLHSPRLPPISYLGLINLCSEPTCYCLYTVAAPCSGEQRGFGQGTRNGTGSRSQSALIRDLSTDDTGWQEKKKLEQIQHSAKTSRLFVQPSCCSLFDVQHSRKLPDPAGSSSVRLPGTRHKTTAGHQHCNFLTYNKAISYFLPYK